MNVNICLDRKDLRGVVDGFNAFTEGFDCFLYKDSFHSCQLGLDVQFSRVIIGIQISLLVLPSHVGIVVVSILLHDHCLFWRSNWES
jgi:hypothetical protein